MHTLPRTVPELFLQAVERHDNPAFMRYKAGGEFASIPAQEFRKEVELAAFGLIELGVQQGDRVALLSENRPGWAFADLATLSVGAWSVPIYTSLMPDEIQYILNDCSAVACFVSTAEQLAKIETVRARCPALKHVITLEPIESTEPSIMTARSLLEQGQAFRSRSPGALEQRLAAIEPEHTASILYTSGTTGQPKGVMLSHNNFVSNVIDGLKSLAILTTDTHLIDNMSEVHPTVMTSVPRLYEKLYAGVLQKATDAGGLKKQLVLRPMPVASRSSSSFGPAGSGSTTPRNGSPVGESPPGSRSSTISPIGWCSPSCASWSADGCGFSSRAALRWRR
jgi:long-chain acyl-CoA synthetase